MIKLFILDCGVGKIGALSLADPQQAVVVAAEHNDGPGPKLECRFLAIGKPRGQDGQRWDHHSPNGR